MKFENTQIFFFLNLMYLIILVIGNPTSNVISWFTLLGEE